MKTIIIPDDLVRLTEIINILDLDTDDDGILNADDLDDDNDEVFDSEESSITSIGTLEDYDGDGIINFEDLDIDGD
jgi:hypothetical protein